MSGGNFATSLLQAGVIDEIGLNIHPVLLGSGVPAFLDPGKRVKLELTECRQLDGGCVMVTYRVKPSRQQA
jgi:riboflavin biosynthesis pyrimidine reductase